jgi:hypothetical protein
MVHRMCVDCRIRSHSLRPADDPLYEPCPSCGKPLEQVDTLTSIVGFRWFSPGDAIDAPVGEDFDGLDAGAVRLPVPGASTDARSGGARPSDARR